MRAARLCQDRREEASSWRRTRPRDIPRVPSRCFTATPPPRRRSSALLRVSPARLLFTESRSRSLIPSSPPNPKAPPYYRPPESSHDSPLSHRNLPTSSSWSPLSDCSRGASRSTPFLRPPSPRPPSPKLSLGTASRPTANVHHTRLTDCPFFLPPRRSKSTSLNPISFRLHLRRRFGPRCWS